MRFPPEAKIDGPSTGPESPGLAAAIWAHRYAEKRRPDERFPMTRAAREALRVWRSSHA